MFCCPVCGTYVKGAIVKREGKCPGCEELDRFPLFDPFLYEDIGPDVFADNIEAIDIDETRNSNPAQWIPLGDQELSANIQQEGQIIPIDFPRACIFDWANRFPVWGADYPRYTVDPEGDIGYNPIGINFVHFSMKDGDCGFAFYLNQPLAKIGRFFPWQVCSPKGKTMANIPDWTEEVMSSTLLILGEICSLSEAKLVPLSIPRIDWTNKELSEKRIWLNIRNPVRIAVPKRFPNFAAIFDWLAETNKAFQLDKIRKRTIELARSLNFCLEGVAFPPVKKKFGWPLRIELARELYYHPRYRSVNHFALAQSMNRSNSSMAFWEAMRIEGDIDIATATKAMAALGKKRNWEIKIKTPKNFTSSNFSTFCLSARKIRAPKTNLCREYNVWIEHGPPNPELKINGGDKFVV